MALLVRFLMLLAFLLIPGAGIVGAIVLVWKKIKLIPPVHPILYRVDGSVEYSWFDKMHRDHRFRWFVGWIIPGLLNYAQLSLSMWWSEKISRYWRKEYMLDMRGPDYEFGKLSGGEMMLYAAFAALIRWAQTDGVHVLEQIDVTDDPMEDFHKHPREYRLRALYWWWLDVRPRRCAEIAEMSGVARGEALDQQAATDQQMLQLLLDSRYDML